MSRRSYLDARVSYFVVRCERLNGISEQGFIAGYSIGGVQFFDEGQPVMRIPKILRHSLNVKHKIVL